MKRLIFLTLLITGLGCSVMAQTPEPTPCVENCVTISRDAAIKAVETSRERDALKIQLATEKQAFDALRNELNEMRIKFAAVSGELSGIKQNAVQDRAIIDLLLKNTKRKCLPFSICLM